jgi:hypothetical protein
MILSFLVSLWIQMVTMTILSYLFGKVYISVDQKGNHGKSQFLSYSVDSNGNHENSQFLSKSVDSNGNHNNSQCCSWKSIDFCESKR